MTGTAEDHVREWVESSGRALELRVARAFARSGASVRQAAAFRDPTDGRTRECDVVAEYEWLDGETSCGLTACVEVKSGATHEWVAFRSGQRQSPGSAGWFAFLGKQETVDPPSYRRMPGMPPFDEGAVATHLVVAGTKQDGDSRDLVAYGAMMQAMSAARSELARFTQLAIDRRPLLARAVIPVVVIAAPLFLCGLDDVGEIELTQVDRVDVLAPGSDAPSRLYVCTEQAVDQFAKDLSRRVQEFK